MSEALRPLREAVDKGEVRAVPLGSALLDPAGYEKLVAEYGFYVGQERLAEKQQGRPETQVATIALTRGGWHYTGVDIDRNGRLDVLMAESANQIFFIYDLERMPADKTLGLGRERLVVNPSGLTTCRGKFSGAYVIQRPPPEPTAPTPVPPPWWAASPEGFLTLNQTCSPVSQIEVGFYPLALVRSGAGLPPRLRADATKPEVEEWVGRTTDFTLRVPAPISKAYELPPLPEGYAWSANSMSLQQIHWTSSTEGEILFSLDCHHQDRPFFASGQYRFRIPFNLTAPQTIRLGDAIQSGSPSR